MVRFKYRDGCLYCKNCGKHFREIECPMFYSPGKAGMKWRVCPECPTKWKLRKGSHNKKWKEYYQRVQKPQMDKERELYLMVVKQKEK